MNKEHWDILINADWGALRLLPWIYPGGGPQKQAKDRLIKALMARTSTTPDFTVIRSYQEWSKYIDEDIVSSGPLGFTMVEKITNLNPEAKELLKNPEYDLKPPED